MLRVDQGVVPLFTADSGSVDSSAIAEGLVNHSSSRDSTPPASPAQDSGSGISQCVRIEKMSPVGLDVGLVDEVGDVSSESKVDSSGELSDIEGEGPCAVDGEVAECASLLEEKVDDMG